MAAAALPTPSVAVAVTSKAPALPNACVTASPGAPVPSPKLHAIAEPVQRSVAAAAIPTPARADAEAGTLTAVSVGGAASKPAASTRQSLIPAPGGGLLWRKRVQIAAALPWSSTASVAPKSISDGSAALSPRLMSVTAPKALPAGRRAAWTAGRAPLSPIQIATAAPSGATSTFDAKPVPPPESGWKPVNEAPDEPRGGLHDRRAHRRLREPHRRGGVRRVDGQGGRHGGRARRRRLRRAAPRAAGEVRRDRPVRGLDDLPGEVPQGGGVSVGREGERERSRRAGGRQRLGLRARA